MKKETELQQLLKQKQESRKNKESPVLKDRVERTILKGDWVKSDTPGNGGKVVGLKFWVTFEDVIGVNKLESHVILQCAIMVENVTQESATFPASTVNCTETPNFSETISTFNSRECKPPKSKHLYAVTNK